MKQPPLHVTEANGSVVAVQVPIADWIALLERLCDLEDKLRPKTKLDRKLETLVRQRVGNKKNVALDDIGFIGTGRAMSEAESLLISAHLQVRKSSASYPRLQPSSR